MCTRKAREPYSIAHSFAIDELSVEERCYENHTYFEIVLSASNALNIAERIRSSKCCCKFDPDLGSKSFSPRFGIMGRADGPLAIL